MGCHHCNAMARVMAVLSAVAMVVAVPSVNPSSETQAQVVETPGRIMTVQSFATFNNGKPFLAEPDPITGTLDLRKIPVNTDDYLYEEIEESETDPVDRKDTVATGTSNHIISIPAKDSELHKFLNLPVHFASSSKFPLISNSYANTKVQGHGTSNHRPATSTPSTIQPSYYPHRTTSQSTTSTTISRVPTEAPRTTARYETTKPSTISTTTATPSTSAASPPPPAYEYEYEYDYGEPNDKPPSSPEPSKSDYDFMGFFSSLGLSGSSSTARVPIQKSTARPTTTTSYTSDPMNHSSVTDGEPVHKEGEHERLATTTESSTSVRHPSEHLASEKNESEQFTKSENSSKTTESTSSVVPELSKKENSMTAIRNEIITKKNMTASDVLENGNHETTTTETTAKTTGHLNDPQSNSQFKMPNVESGDWKGKPGQSAEVLPVSVPEVPQFPLTVPQSFSETKPDGTYHVKYSAARPVTYGAKRPTVPQVTNASSDDKDSSFDESLKKTQTSPSLSQAPVLHAQIHSAPGQYYSGSSRPSLENQNQIAATNFSDVEKPVQQSSQQYHGSNQQVYHAAITDDKQYRLPASTYLQRPLIYDGQQYHVYKDKESSNENKKNDEKFVSHKATYRPYPSQPQQPAPFQKQPPNLPPPLNFTQEEQPFQKLPPQQFGASQYHQPGVQPQPSINEESVAWPPKTQSHRDEPNVPPPSFFPRPAQAPPGIGTVEAVRPPPRLPNRGSVAVSTVSGDTQSYSLQTSFSIGIPSGQGDDKPTVTQGTVSTVPLTAIQSGPSSIEHQQHNQRPIPHPQQSSQLSYPPKSKLPLQQSLSGPSPQLGQPISANTIKYPKPSWETNLNKPYKEPNKRNPLPNILPQFRPNAKIGIIDPPGDPPHSIGVLNHVREPTDRLQPPPLPAQRPLHRSDEQQQHYIQHHRQHQHQPHKQQQQNMPVTHVYQPVRPVASYHTGELQATAASSPYTVIASQPGSLPVPPQPVHRRNGVGTKVATLQMIQSPPPSTRNNEEPVMIVYPSNNHGEASSHKENWREPPPDFENDDKFPHDLEDLRIKDTPILKSKPPTPKLPMKVDFPYPLVKPTTDTAINEQQALIPTSSAPEKAATSDESIMGHHLPDHPPMMNNVPSGAASLGPTPPSAKPNRVGPIDGEFGWSVIGTRTEEYEQTTTPLTNSVSTSGMLAPPKLTGGFRPIPAPVQV